MPRMTTVAPAPIDVEQLLHDARPPCEVADLNHPNESRVAEWVVHWRPCGCDVPSPPTLLCDPCIEELRATDVMMCTGCHWRYSPGWSIVQATERI